jgi:hypothetical protein
VLRRRRICTRFGATSRRTVQRSPTELPNASSNAPVRLRSFPIKGGPELGEGVRCIVIERWLVLYRVRAESVFVGRIIDGARHLGRIRVPKV